MDQTNALFRLDEIEQLDPDPTIDAGALEIMEALAAKPEGLQLLVDRYSSSPSANIAGYLALLLGKQSSKSTLETAPLVFEFVAKLKRNDLDGALISSLSAMQNQISFGPGWGDTLRAPSSLFPFLKHCLDFSGKRHALVHFAAIELLSTICWGSLLNEAFESEEIEWIQKRVNEISLTHEILVLDAISEFRDCLKNKKHAITQS